MTAVVPAARQIGVFGGSFNPVHCGHIALARHLADAMGLDAVWFVVSPLNPFKTKAPDLLDDGLRYELTVRALEGEDRLYACDCELHLPRPSYMWKTLDHLSRQYPDTCFTLLVGADNWLAFDRWAHSDEILSRYRLAVYPRAGYEVADRNLPPNVSFVSSPLYPVSSTQIRRRIASGLPVSGLVPPAIENLVCRYYRDLFSHGK